MDELRKAKIELKKREVKERIRSAWNKTVDFVDRNKEIIVVTAPVVIGGGAKIAGAIKRHETIKAEKRHKNLDHYDPRTGTWSHARRKLSKTERLELDRRYTNGESKIEILNDLGVLK